MKKERIFGWWKWSPPSSALHSIHHISRSASSAGSTVSEVPQIIRQLTHDRDHIELIVSQIFDFKFREVFLITLRPETIESLLVPFDSKVLKHFWNRSVTESVIPTSSRRELSIVVGEKETSPI